jgi:hypothetical protein
LHRYLAEFDFRYSNRVALGISDVARADRALKGIVGKSPTYQNASQVRGRMGKRGEKQKRKPKIKDKKQSERFKETARELGADHTSNAFDRIVETMARIKSSKGKDHG